MPDPIQFGPTSVPADRKRDREADENDDDDGTDNPPQRNRLIVAHCRIVGQPGVDIEQIPSTAGMERPPA
jgi:hypothetical protein